MTEWEAAGWAGIGRLYQRMDDSSAPLPAAGTPDRERSDAEHRAMCAGLMRQFEMGRNDAR